MEKRAFRLAAMALIMGSAHSPALAYLDGATGSILLQAAIGLIASWMVYYRMFTARAKALLARITGRAPAKPKDE